MIKIEKTEIKELGLKWELQGKKIQKETSGTRKKQELIDQYIEIQETEKYMNHI